MVNKSLVSSRIITYRLMELLAKRDNRLQIVLMQVQLRDKLLCYGLKGIRGPFLEPIDRAAINDRGVLPQALPKGFPYGAHA